MIDPTAPTNLDSPLEWIDLENDSDFAQRAAGYLRDEGLDAPSIAFALRAELGLSAAEATRLAGACLPATAPTELACSRHSGRVSDSPWRGSPSLTPIHLMVEPTAH